MLSPLNLTQSKRKKSMRRRAQPHDDDDGGGAGGSPVVVFHAVPGGTCQSPWHAQFQSVFAMISRCAATNVGTGHLPSLSSGHPRMPVSGATPSLMMTRICGSGWASQESTGAGVDWRSVVGGRVLARLTLELDVGRERRQVGGLERAVLGHVVGREGPVDGEVGQVESGND